MTKYLAAVTQTQASALDFVVRTEVERCLQQAERYFKRDFPMPSISYKLRGMNAGVAYPQRGELRFNHILLSENLQEFRQQIIPHEVSHLLAYWLFGKVKPHGKEWQGIMQQVFKRPAEVTHRLNTASIPRKCFVYRCHCQTHELTAYRHNRIERHQQTYVCRRCKGHLQKVVQ